jgi:hypothetical protein
VRSVLTGGLMRKRLINDLGIGLPTLNNSVQQYRHDDL